ncbi:uncharacterized protein BJX67DRAFT_318851 [Aspergillus lucknowensis]|uniref:Uncharacterized protein n=1 Tax=Aspergillus lucknowensis TaxID=176173 RepID=A0ABR4M219_9EURO
MNCSCCLFVFDPSCLLPQGKQSSNASFYSIIFLLLFCQTPQPVIVQASMEPWSEQPYLGMEWNDRLLLDHHSDKREPFVMTVRTPLKAAPQFPNMVGTSIFLYRLWNRSTSNA